MNNPDRIKKTFNNFGYICNDLKSYNSTEIIQELTAGYPCIMSGYCFEIKKKILGITWDVYHKGAHEWLIHGLLTRKRLRTEYGFYGSLISSYYEGHEHYFLCNMGESSTSSNGYYLAGVFDTDAGPVFTRSEDDPITSGEDGNYQYKLRMTTGIRKQ